jgi:hypothetical protein
MKKEKIILENFVKIFNKIKRINESELTEIDYEKVYSDTNPWDDQSIKIDDYPAEGKNLDSTIHSAEIAINGENWEEKKEQRHRFLMDDNALLEYYNKLKKIKNALDKHASGEELSDFERKVVRFYKSDKKNQKSRMKSAAGNKLDSNFMKNFDKSMFQKFSQEPIEVTSRNTREKTNMVIGDVEPEQTSDGVRLKFKAKINQESGVFVVYEDGSHGFKNDGGDEWNDLFVSRDTEFIKLAASTLRKIRPARNY